MTERDEELIRWLSWVRLADTASVRVMLGALAGRSVSSTVAVRRIGALRRAGLVDTARVQNRASQVVWATLAATGSRPSSPYGAGAVHALGVAAATAAAQVGGADSVPDRVDGVRGDRRADGVLRWPTGGEEFLEVELSVKQPARVRAKVAAMRSRWAAETVVGTLYVVGSAEVGRLVRRVSDEVLGAESGRVRIVGLASVVEGAWSASLPPVGEPIVEAGRAELEGLRWD